MAEPSDMARTVGRRVKALRKARGFESQAALAEALSLQGVETSRDVVANLENERRERISIEELFALAIALNVAPIDLLVEPEVSAVEAYAVTPSTEANAARVRSWLAGWPSVGEGDPVDFMAAAPRARRVEWEHRGHLAIAAIENLLSDVQDAVQLAEGASPEETIYGGNLDALPDLLDEALAEVTQHVQLLKTALERRKAQEEQSAIDDATRRFRSSRPGGTE